MAAVVSVCITHYAINQANYVRIIVHLYSYHTPLISFFFFNDPPPTEISPLSLHDALPMWTVPVHQGGGAFDARTWRRRDRQYHLDLFAARLDAAFRLRHQQGRAGASDKAARGGAGLARHPRQRRRAWPGGDRDGESRAHAGDPRRLSRRHPAQPLRPRGGTRGSDFFPVQRSRELHHRTDSRSRRRL